MFGKLEMIKLFSKKILKILRLDINKIIKRLGKWSINSALSEEGFCGLLEKLRKIQPDLSQQYSKNLENFNDYWELNIRGMHAFQCFLMLKALENLALNDNKVTVVDIGDSSGTHMLYLRELTKDRLDIDTLSVNLDSRAIEKIKARGMKAILCRAEELDMEKKKVDLFVSFEMVEHLHNPAIFFRSLAKKSRCNRMVITVPYLRNSRIGLYYIRNKSDKDIFAEDEHIFELSLQDWTLLLRHSGWRVTYSKIYYQYPTRIPLISKWLASHWRRADFEGFWGAILEKDTRYSDFYKDWQE